MERSKQQEEEILKLGKKLVAELDLENNGNTLTRWMAHYLAELIYKVENSSSEIKEQAKKECFEVISKLWDTRRYIPHFSKPIDELEPLIELLDVLNKIIIPIPILISIKKYQITLLGKILLIK